MQEQQVIELENRKKYYVHDSIVIGNIKYLYLIKINNEANDFENEILFLKEEFIDGKNFFTKVNNEEINMIFSNVLI